MGIGGVVGESLLDGMWNWWGSGQVVANSAETMFVRNVVHSDLMAVLVDIGVVALLRHRLVFLARVLHDAMGALFDSVAALVLVLEVSVLVHLRLGLQDRDVLVEVVLVGVVIGRNSGNQNGTDGNELKDGKKRKTTCGK